MALKFRRGDQRPPPRAGSGGADSGPAETPDRGAPGLKLPQRTVLGPHLSINGSLRGDDDIVIRGRLVGNVRGRRVEVATGAAVEGDITAEEVRVGGAVKGNVEAARIEVARGGGIEGRLENDGSCLIEGEIEGDINSRDVFIAVGAEVDAVITADKVRSAGAIDGVIESTDLKIDETGRLRGDIDSDGRVEIAGKVEGKIRARTVVIAEGAHVATVMKTGEADVAGTLTGEVVSASVTIAATAYVDATIVHHQMKVEDGAVVKGSRPWRPKKYLLDREEGETAAD